MCAVAGCDGIYGEDKVLARDRARVDELDACECVSVGSFDSNSPKTYALSNLHHLWYVQKDATSLAATIRSYLRHDISIGASVWKSARSDPHRRAKARHIRETT